MTQDSTGNGYFHTKRDNLLDIGPGASDIIDITSCTLPMHDDDFIIEGPKDPLQLRIKTGNAHKREIRKHSGKRMWESRFEPRRLQPHWSSSAAMIVRPSGSVSHIQPG